MSRSLVICEKPLQARAIMKAVGRKYGDVLPARGHILTLKEPDDIKEEWKTWSTDLLWPGKFYGKKPVKDTLSFLNAIKDKAKKADRIIIATDCDREGQLIGGEIVDFIGFKGEVLRAIYNAEDPKSLQDAFSSMRPNAEFSGLYQAGQAREQADQISNLSLTRAATVSLRAPGQRGAIGIGRVKTPVLGIICRREIEIQNFKPQDLYEIDATVQVASGNLVLSCNRLPGSLVKQEEGEEGEDEDLAEDEAALEEAESLRGRIVKKEIAEAIAKAVTGFSGTVKSTARRAKQGPPKLFDLTALQSAASSKLNWSGNKTLSVAQKLYAEHTLITYPRADSKYLPENNIPDVPKMVSALLGLKGLDRYGDLLDKPQIRKGKSGHFSDKALQGISHYAIIPNANTANEFRAKVPALGADEAKLFDMIARQYLAALAPDYEYRQTTVSMLFPWREHDWDFRTVGRVPLIPGWRAILGGGKGSEAELPEVKDGEAGKVEKAELRTVTTRPPARYTEGSLIRVMQEVWRLVEDPALRAKLKETRGIGTQATRADVVKGLLEQSQITKTGKSFAPTRGGMELYNTLVSICPNVVDPGRTAVWESLFEYVEKGRITAHDAVEKILKATSAELSQIASRKGEVLIETGGKSKPTPMMVKAAKAIAERKGLSLPKGLASNSSVCRAFLDEHMPKREPGGNGGYAPSEKQLSFAESLSKSAGLEIPEDARSNSKTLSAWIDKAKKKAPPRAPTEKQLAFAEKLADEHGVELPEKARNEMTACSAFIDKHLGRKK